MEQLSVVVNEFSLFLPASRRGSNGHREDNKFEMVTGGLVNGKNGKLVNGEMIILSNNKQVRSHFRPRSI